MEEFIASFKNAFVKLSMPADAESWVAFDALLVLFAYFLYLCLFKHSFKEQAKKKDKDEREEA
jgi:hypothetical protein